jgi:Protein of unknown function (DUF4199)
MKKVILRYGGYGSLFVAVFFIATWLIFGPGDTDSYALQEVLGYAGIVLSLVFVFFGIRHYRDKVNGGSLRFGQGLKLGLLITLLPSLALGFVDVIYVKYFNTDFSEKYLQHSLQSIKGSLTPEQFAVQEAAMREMMATYSNPFFLFGIMFLTVFAIGLIITVVSALVLRKN